MDSVTLRMRRNFDSSAGHYDRLAGIQKKTAELMISQLAETDYGKILDAGCGSGFLSVLLDRSLRPAELLLNDTSGRMLSLCRKKLRTKRVRRFVKEDFLSLKPASRFGLVTANMLFQWFHPIDRPVRKAYHLLEPGGTLAFSLPVAGTFGELSASMKGAGITPERVVLRMSSPRDIRKSLRAAGFRAVFCVLKTYRESYDSVLEFLRRLKETGTGYPVRTPLPAGTLRRVIKEYQDEYGDDKGKIPVTWKILFARCRKP